MSRNGLLVPNVMQAGPPVLNVAAPINDTQLVCLVAAQRGDLEPGDAVMWSQMVVAQAVAREPFLRGLIEQAKAAVAEEMARG